MPRPQVATVGVPAPLPATPGRRLMSFLKVAGVILVLAAAVVFKLGFFLDYWAADDPSPQSPVTARDSKPAASAEVVRPLSLNEHFNFTPGITREFPELNFRFVTPGGSWEFREDPWSREGSVFSLKKIPGPANGREETGTVDFALRVLAPGVPVTADGKRSTALIQSSLEALSPGCRVSGLDGVKLGQGICHRLKVDDMLLAGEPANAEVWFLPLNGLIYEMTTVMPSRVPDYFLHQTARHVVEGFSVIDPARFPRPAVVSAMLDAAGAVPVRNPPVIHGNVTIDLKEGMWNTWPGAANTLPGSVLGFTSRGGIRVAAAFTPAEGVPEDASRVTALLGNIWPAGRHFQWGPPDRRPHQGLEAVTLRGTGTLNSRAGKVEVRAVRCGASFMVLFAFGPGDTHPNLLTNTLDLFTVEPGANGDPDFGSMDDRSFHQRTLAALAAEALAKGRPADAGALYMILFTWDRRPGDLCAAALCLFSAGKREEATRLLAGNESRFAGQTEWEERKMRLLADMGEIVESRRIAESLLEREELTAAQAAVYLEILIEARAFTDAQAFVSRLSSLQPSPVWHLYNALLPALNGDAARTALLFRPLRQEAQSDIPLGIECAKMLMRGRLIPEALELARLLAAKKIEQESLLLLIAECEAALHRNAEARDTYRKILERNPDNSTAREALTALARK